jgi:D-beta-D-heptose 7-phosphate kinase/D-beta-D-heptose 1-phosphate adenosyltransferase
MAANVKDNLEAFGLVVDFITNEEEITKTRFIDEKSGQHLLRVDNDIALRPWNGKTLRPLETYNAIVISDYNKGFLTYELIEKLRREYKGPVFVDTKKQDLSRFDKCFVKINELEYNARFSICPDLIVTLGGKGAMYKRLFNERFFPTIKTEVVDVCGAGDTFLSALTYEYLRSSNMDTAINFANQCSAITVRHRGVYVLTNTDIDSIVS